MGIEFRSANSVEGASLSSMPAHSRYDLLIFFAYNNNSTTVPTVPTGWSSVATLSASGRGAVVAYRVAQGSSESSGTWTNATHVLCAVYRDPLPDKHLLLPGGVTRTNGSSTSTINYAGSAMVGKSGTSPSTESWFVGIAGCSLNSTNFELAPSGMINRHSLAGASAGEITIHDTNAASTSWTAVSRTNSANVAYLSFVVEVFDTGQSVPSSLVIPKRPIVHSPVTIKRLPGEKLIPVETTRHLLVKSKEYPVIYKPVYIRFRYPVVTSTEVPVSSLVVLPFKVPYRHREVYRSRTVTPLYTTVTTVATVPQKIRISSCSRYPVPRRFYIPSSKVRQTIVISSPRIVR